MDRKHSPIVVLVCAIALVGAIPPPGGTPADAATTTTITFEEPIPQPGTVLTQFCGDPLTNKGVEFLRPALIITSPVATASPSHILTNEFPAQEFEEFDILEARFTAPQDEVSVKVGLDRKHGFAVTAFLRAYRSNTPAPADLIKQSSLVLGTGPLSITNLLSVQDPSGEIRSIEIEFAGAQPGNAAIEVIDDLSFPVVGGPCISDSIAPVVSISQPVAGVPTYSAIGTQATSLLAFTATDVGSGVAAVQVSFLDGAGSSLESFYVCGGTAAPCELPPAAVDRTFYTGFPFATATIRVSAWDYADNLGLADRSITVVESQLNVWAQGVEITQAVQPWVATNSDSRSPTSYKLAYSSQAVPLVADRTAVVRVYPGVEGTYNAQPLPGVRASLRCYVDPGYTVPCLGPAVIQPEHDPTNSVYAQISAVPGDTIDAMRAAIDRSWIFVLPSEWIGKGTIHLEAEVLAPDGADECPGCADGANALRVSKVEFQEVPHFGDDLVHFVEVQWQKSGTNHPPTPGTYTPSQADTTAVLDYARKVFPVDETTIPAMAQATYVLQDDDNWDLNHRCDRVTGLLAQAFGNKAGKEAVFGLIHQGYPCSGRGGGGYSYANFNPNSLSTFPHEVGHAVGLKHPGSPPGPPAGHAAECQNPGWCDTDWPYSHGGMGTFGFDVFEFEVIDPSPPGGGHTHDLMSYGNPVWISDRNWIRLFNAFTASSLPYPKATSVEEAAARVDDNRWSQSLDLTDAAEPTGLFLWVRGVLDDKAGWTLLPAYEMAAPHHRPDPGVGDYRIELRGIRDQLLASHPFSIPSEHIDMADGQILAAPPSFAELIALPEGVETITLLHGEDTLASKQRSPTAPVVTLGSPTREGFTRNLIGWTANDEDRGDELHALVQYSAWPETGEWDTLATDVTESRLEVGFALPGSPDAQVRVLVTDGINTTQVLSPTFAVDDQPPTADILSLDTTVAEGDRVVLRGTGSDLEDGVLTGAALTWRSDKDGFLGTGSRLEVTSLSPLLHEIILEARDSRQQVAVDVFVVIVEEQERVNHQPIAQAGGPMLLVHGLSTPLDGRASHDADGDTLTYQWELLSQDAFLASPDSARATLTVEGEGVYEVALTVNDGELDSVADTMLVEFSDEPDRIVGDLGLVDPTSGEWHLRTAAGPEHHFYFGTPGDYPMIGDWDCDGIDTPGLYRESDGYVYLVNVNETGEASIRFHLGIPGDIPLAGDFDGDGCDTVSVYRPSEGRVFITDVLGENEGWFVAERDYYFGVPGDKPYVGDFDGDGIDTIGLHRESTGLVYFLNRHATAVADSEFYYGIPGDRLVAGDWNGDGADSVAIFRPEESRFYFRFSNTQGFADVNFPLGQSGWRPVAGTFG